MDRNRGVSDSVLSLHDSVTHGTAARLAELNRGLAEDEQIIDLSIGALDATTDERIDRAVADFVQSKPDVLHAFAPVRGFTFLRHTIAARASRLDGMDYDPETEIIVSPGGVKGSLTIAFHALLNPGDQVIVPVPNWPHYPDMVRLHGAMPVTVMAPTESGLTPDALRGHLTDHTKMVILGDCINPTGKVYTTAELTELAAVLAEHNARREAVGHSPVYVVFDCPYEAHVLHNRAQTFAALEAVLPNGGRCSMRPYTVTVTGPGKTYGMHGDRIGYLCGPADVVKATALAQVNLTSFASTYGQVATNAALQPEMDEVATQRALMARMNLETMFGALGSAPGLSVRRPQGGYFLFVDLSAHADSYRGLGHDRADQFLLAEARVATISGRHFAEGAVGPAVEALDHVVRINCGRTTSLLTSAGHRIRTALERLSCCPRGSTKL
ncbi:pyridoxal phosphate-dependent aminotransferase [Pseudonocardia sp. ICBG1293]|uniref:pyridoxal phosphate-dependent aminotransferase n=1 Tax=Pseudonocardia sp. ICBG1293 TaxID=2844382 RepID=UPI001CCFC79E|nr:pyridoxal phosphate-dependent aminotransferase [Pseudonocardia sp. ICBG1293]